MAIHTYWCAAALNRPDRPNPVVFTKNRSTISYLMNMNFLSFFPLPIARTSSAKVVGGVRQATPLFEEECLPELS